MKTHFNSFYCIIILNVNLQITYLKLISLIFYNLYNFLLSNSIMNDIVFPSFYPSDRRKGKQKLFGKIYQFSASHNGICYFGEIMKQIQKTA